MVSGIWTLSLWLVALFGEVGEVWPCWRKYITRIWIWKYIVSPHFQFALFHFSSKSWSLSLLPLPFACVPLPTIMVSYSSRTISQNKLFPKLPLIMVLYHSNRKCPVNAYVFVFVYRYGQVPTESRKEHQTSWAGFIDICEPPCKVGGYLFIPRHLDLK